MAEGAQSMSNTTQAAPRAPDYWKGTGLQLAMGCFREWFEAAPGSKQTYGSAVIRTTLTALFGRHAASWVVFGGLDDDLLQPVLADPSDWNITVIVGLDVEPVYPGKKRSGLTEIAPIIKPGRDRFFGIEFDNQVITLFWVTEAGEVYPMDESRVPNRWVRGQWPGDLELNGMPAFAGFEGLIATTTGNRECHKSNEPVLHAASEVGETSSAMIAGRQALDKQNTRRELDPWQCGDLEELP